MTQEIIEMAQECGLVGMRPHLDGIYIESLLAFAKRVEEKALAEHAMQEVQRLGQEIEQEPVAWLLTDKNINSLQVDSIQRLIDRLKHAHHTDLCVRINGQDEWFQADWLKHMVRVTPPQPEQEPVAWQWLGSAHFRKKLPKNADITAWNPLYTYPPQENT